MVKKKKVDHDKYYHLAKEHGYRSRASFKLIQLNKKFDFLSSTKCCIDLCAAPGGWLQVAQKFMPKQSLIIGVDLLPIRPIRDVFTLEEDITTAKCRGELNRLMKGMKANLVLHDGAPNVGTSWEQDAFTQSTLTLASLRLATEFLAPNGMFVTKVFRSSDYNSLLWVFKQLFTKVTVTKPPASRNTSAEIYAVCQGYLAPKEIDHRFLDPKHVFKELDTVAESQLLKGMKRASRHREGYDEDAGQSTLLFKQSSILDFLHAEFPVEVLSKNYVLEWKERKSSTTPAEIEADKALIAQLWNHRKTKPDIKEGVGDIKNMSHRGIKQLLRWRLDMREAFVDGPKDAKASTTKKIEEEAADPEKEEEDELQSLLRKLEMRQKRKERKERKKRAKQQHRIDLKLDIPNDRFDTDGQEGDQLFRLRAIESVDQLTQVNKGEISGVDEMLNEVSDDELDGAEESDDEEVLDSADYEKKRKRELERTLELQYREYMDRQKRREEEPQSTRRKKRKHAETTLVDLYAEIDRTNSELLEKAKEKASGVSSSSSSSSKDSDSFYHGSDSEDDEDSGDEETKRLRNAERDLLIQAALLTRNSSNPLIRKSKQSASAQSKLWFDSELFEGAEDDIEDNAFAPKKPKKTPVPKKTLMKDDNDNDNDETVEDNVYTEEDEDAEMALQTALDQGGDDDDDDEEDNDDAATKKYKELLAATATPTSSKDKGKNKNTKDKEGDFEVVPFEEKYTVRADEDTQEIIEEIEALEDHEKAQLLAMATLVKTGRMSWSQLLDFGFNRYCFTDSADAPQWFRDDESRHNKPRLPVTKQMMDEIRAEWREIASRPIKKVAEAKARKRIRSKKQLDSIKNKANAIVADNELSEAQKRKQIEKLHKKRSASEKPKVVTVVRKKFQKNKRRVGPKGKTGTKIKVVDGRMKKELRAQKRKAASKKR